MITPLIEGFSDEYYDDGPRDDLAGVAYHFTGYGHDPIDIDYAELAVAVYDQADYSGEAFILFRDTRDGQWYEVYASHCSCYGLEDQWEPELADRDALLMRNSFVGYSPEYSDEYKEINARIRSKIEEAWAAGDAS